MMKKLLVLIGLVLINCATVSAQTNKNEKNNLNRELEVTREYEPTVKRATKIDVRPNMEDTVKLRPELNYNITTESVYNRERLAIKPIGVADVKIVTARQEIEKLNIEAGLGVPLKSMANIDYALYSAPNAQINVNLKHNAIWSKIKNDADIKAPAETMNNNISLFANRIWKSGGISGGVYGILDKYSRYGYYNFGAPIPTSFDTQKSALAQRFSGGGIEMALNNFGNRLNFNLSLEAAAITDKYDGGRADLKAGVGFGYNFKNGNIFDIQLATQMAKGKSVNKTDISLFSLKPMYTLNFKDLLFGLGFDVSATKSGSNNSESKICFFPKLNLEIDIKNSALFFVNLRGGIYIDPYMANPYLLSDVETPMSKQYELSAGVSGNIGKLKYTIGAGYDIMNDAPTYVNVFDDRYLGNVFYYMTDDVNVVKAFVNLDANLSERIELRAGILFRSADSDKLSNALYLPKLEGSFAVKYNSPKFNAKINCDLMGEQFFGENITNETETTTQVVKADSFANLMFDCNFKIYENIFLGIEVDNILNSNIYKFNHYRQLGTNVLAKVNFKF